VKGSATPFDRIATAAGDTLCTAAGGDIVTEVNPGTNGAGHAFVNVISNDTEPPGGVQGWSFSIAFDGADLSLDTVTTLGTSVPDYYAGGFNKTQIINPDDPANAGQRGCVSAIVLSFTTEANLPLVGTESVLDIEYESLVAQTDADNVGSVKFKTGLKGAGQPVQNATTVAGGTVGACNFTTAQANLIFRKNPKKPFAQFIRGNPNDDAKVNIADPIWIINELFRSGPPTLCPDAADANGDTQVDASDAVYLIAYLFLSGAPPIEPFPLCGLPAVQSEACVVGTVTSCPQP